jgi:hypothetical protein
MHDGRVVGSRGVCLHAHRGVDAKTCTTLHNDGQERAWRSSEASEMRLGEAMASSAREQLDGGFGLARRPRWRD